MIELEKIEGIYLYQGTTDMRRGMHSLLALASTLMEKKDMLHRLFVFCGRDKKDAQDPRARRRRMLALPEEMRDRKVLLAEGGGRRGDDRQKAAPVAA
jgi:hypothetical protein